MKILLSNDDGIHAQGINCLFDSLSQDHHVEIIAPDRDSSGVSQSLTLHQPLRVRHLDNYRMVVDGTPADCINLATRGLMKENPDVIISGINHGANLGDDVMYSGTVAAAMEGRFAAKLCMAVSLLGVNHFDTAVHVVRQILTRADHWSDQHGRVLNINVPDRPLDELAGIRICKLGQRGIGQPMITIQDPRGHARHWIGKAGDGVGEDFDLVEQGFVTVTPLHTDMTDYQSMDALQELGFEL